MEKTVFTPSAIRYLCKRRGNENYQLRHVEMEGVSIKNLIFEDKRSGRKLSGKLITKPKEGEAYHWPRLQHENLAPLLEVVSINEMVSIYLSTFFDKSLRDTVNAYEFLWSPNCFERKKSYAEDILWGLDYLHEKRLCLMNLNELNIYIDVERDKAVIMNFKCLTLTERAMKCCVAVPNIYRAPELKNDCFKFDARAAEMWACGTLMLAIFMGHIIPTNFSGDGTKIVSDIVGTIQPRTLAEANPGSLIASDNCIPFRNFLNLFLTTDPSIRTTAKNAAVSPFLQKVRGGSDQRFGKLWELCSNQRRNGTSFVNSAEHSKQSCQKEQEIARNSRSSSSGDFACEVEQCKKNLQSCSPFNKFVNLKYVSKDQMPRKDRFGHSLSNAKGNEQGDTNTSENNVILQKNINVPCQSPKIEAMAENSEQVRVQTFENNNRLSEVANQIPNFGTISSTVMSGIESAEMDEGHGINISDKNCNNECSVNDFSAITLRDDIKKVHNSQNQYTKLCPTKDAIHAEDSKKHFEKKIEEMDNLKDISFSEGNRKMDSMDCSSHFVSMLNSRERTPLNDIFLRNIEDTSATSPGTNNTNSEKEDNNHKISPHLSEILEDKCESIKQNTDILDLKRAHMVINTSENNSNSSLFKYSTGNYPTKTGCIDQDDPGNRGTSRSETDSKCCMEIFPNCTKVKEAKSKNLNHSFGSGIQRIPSDLKISDKVLFSQNSEPSLCHPRSSCPENWKENINTSRGQNLNESNICGKTEKIIGLLDTNGSKELLNTKSKICRYKWGYPMKSESSDKHKNPQINDSHFSNETASMDKLKECGKINNSSHITEGVTIEDVVKLRRGKEGSFVNSVLPRDQSNPEELSLKNDTVDNLAKNSIDVLSSNAASNKHSYSFATNENVNMPSKNDQTIEGWKLRGQNKMVETQNIPDIAREANILKNAFNWPEAKVLNNYALDQDAKHGPSSVSEDMFKSTDIATSEDVLLQKKENASAESVTISSAEISLNSAKSTTPLDRKKKKHVKKFLLRFLCPGCKVKHGDKEKFFAAINEQ